MEYDTGAYGTLAGGTLSNRIQDTEIKTPGPLATCVLLSGIFSFFFHVFLFALPKKPVVHTTKFFFNSEGIFE